MYNRQKMSLKQQTVVGLSLALAILSYFIPQPYPSPTPSTTTRHPVVPATKEPQLPVNSAPADPHPQQQRVLEKRRLAHAAGFQPLYDSQPTRWVDTWQLLKGSAYASPMLVMPASQSETSH
ncbi:MAG: hypothetical protein R3310_16190 [Candidatus Competibacteraceae bacterium]|nr:hypothetical protein [Candidatus Competibacteraceae bacterium]